MQVILLEHVKGFGRKGEVKSVKDGYFHNFLAPKKLAQIATDGAVIDAKKRIEKELIEKERLQEEAEQVFNRLNALEIVIKGKAKSNTLYAAVNAEQIIDAVLSSAKIRLNKTSFVGNIHIKELGIHQVLVKLSPKFTAKLKVNIIEAV